MICFSIKSIDTFLSYFHIIMYDDFSIWFVESNEWRSVLWINDKRESLWTCLLQKINKSFIFIRCVFRCHSKEDESCLKESWMNDDAWWLKKKDVCLFNKEDVSESDWSWSNSRKFFIIDSINRFWMNAYWMSDRSSSNSTIVCFHWFYEFSDVVLVFQDWIIR